MEGRLDLDDKPTVRGLHDVSCPAAWLRSRRSEVRSGKERLASKGFEMVHQLQESSCAQP